MINLRIEKIPPDTDQKELDEYLSGIVQVLSLTLLALPGEQGVAFVVVKDEKAAIRLQTGLRKGSFKGSLLVAKKLQNENSD